METWESRPLVVPASVEINDATWSPDGKQIAASCTDASVRIWKLACPFSGSHRIRLRNFNVDPTLHAISWNPEGTRIHVSTGTGQLAVLKTYMKNHKISYCKDAVQGIHSLSWNPTGTQLYAACSDGRLRSWRYTKNNWGLVRVLNIHTQPMTAIEIAADGYHAIAGFANGEHRLFVIDVGRFHQTMWHEHENEVTAIAASPAGGVFVTASLDGTVRMYEISDDRVTDGTPPCLRVIQHPAPVTGVSWSRDGTCFATSCDDMRLRVWSRATGKCLETIQLSEPADRVLWSPTGSHIATCHRTNITIWTRSGTTLEAHFKTLVDQEAERLASLVPSD